MLTPEEIELNNKIVETFIATFKAPGSVDLFVDEYNLSAGDMVYIFQNLHSNGLFGGKFIEMLLESNVMAGAGMSIQAIIQTVFLKGLAIGYAIRVHEETLVRDNDVRVED